jgi:hypothetical protein
VGGERAVDPVIQEGFGGCGVDYVEEAGCLGSISGMRVARVGMEVRVLTTVKKVLIKSVRSPMLPVEERLRSSGSGGSSSNSRVWMAVFDGWAARSMSSWMFWRNDRAEQSPR